MTKRRINLKTIHLFAIVCNESILVKIIVLTKKKKEKKELFVFDSNQYESSFINQNETLNYVEFSRNLKKVILNKLELLSCTSLNIEIFGNLLFHA